MKLVRASDAAFTGLWETLRRADGLCHAIYGARNLDYYREYFGGDFQDVSFLILVADEPVAGVRMTRHAGESGSVFSCYGLPVLYLARAGLPARTRRDAAAALKAEFASVSADAAYRVESMDFLAGGGLSELSRHLLGLGARAEPFFTQVVDLSRTEEQLHSDLSKSFRWNVNWGQKHLSLRTTTAGPNASRDMEILHALHRDAAGRETRSASSWMRQADMVNAGEAFVVVAELEGEPVSAAMFSLSPAHCFYGVSASRRALFDKPISHALVWEALCHAKRLGGRWFETGEQLYPGTGTGAPSDKELGISSFKRGFGGTTHVRLKIRLEQHARDAQRDAR